MIPTVLILVILVVIGFGILYKVVSACEDATEPTAEQKQKAADEYRWNQGFAFNTLKVPANAYVGLPEATAKEKVPGYIDLKSFSAVIFTQEHGAYLSSRVKDIVWGKNTIELVIVFPDALGNTTVEYFVVLNGENEIVYDGAIFVDLPISLQKGDRFQITQTINLRGQDDKV